MHQPLFPYSPERDVYRLLGVPASASSDEIAVACRRLARTFHPDRNGSTRANQEMQVVNAVRRVMTDPGTRAAYDHERARFHATRTRFGSSPSPAPAARRPGGAPPPALHTAPMPPVLRYARAAAVGMRALISALAPARCRTCRIVIDRADSYCAACGTPLLTGG